MAMELVESIHRSWDQWREALCCDSPVPLSPLHTHTEERFGAEEQWPLQEEQVLPEIQYF